MHHIYIQLYEIISQEIIILLSHRSYKLMQLLGWRLDRSSIGCRLCHVRVGCSWVDYLRVSLSKLLPGGRKLRPMRAD